MNITVDFQNARAALPQFKFAANMSSLDAVSRESVTKIL